MRAEDWLHEDDAADLLQLGTTPAEITFVLCMQAQQARLPLNAIAVRGAVQQTLEEALLWLQDEADINGLDEPDTKLLQQLRAALEMT